MTRTLLVSIVPTDPATTLTRSSMEAVTGYRIFTVGLTVAGPASRTRGVTLRNVTKDVQKVDDVTVTFTPAADQIIEATAVVTARLVLPAKSPAAELVVELTSRQRQPPST